MEKVSSKIRIFSWFISGLIKKYQKILVTSFIIGIVAFLIVKYFYPTIRPIINPDTERIAVIGSYTPSNLPLHIQNLISSGLTKITEEGSSSADLAESWVISEDGKNYKFQLKTGVKWHDGKLLTSSDVNYNLKDAIIVPLGDFEFEVRLKNPYVPLPILLSKPLFKKGLIGTGPYKVRSLKLNEDVIQYLELVPVNDSNLHKKIYKFYSSEDKAITAFKLGEVDVIENLNNLGNLKDWKTIKVEENVLYNRYVAMFFNTTNKYLANKEIRQALSLASPAIESEKPLTPISPMSWAYYAKVKEYNYNPEEAKKRLSDSELATSSAKLTISTFQDLLPTANIVAEQWQKIGVNTEIKLENSIPSDYDILLVTQEIPPDPDQYPLWHSIQSTTNLSKINNPKIDKLLEDGRVTKDSDERLKIYADFQRFLAEEAPVAFLYYPKVYSISRK